MNRLTVESLVRHSDFLRRLARAMLGDESAVDDVLQETWIAALGTAPRRPGALRSWLARIVRNRALDRLRRDAARKRHEGVPRSDPRLPAPDELLERYEARKQVADAVLDLEEPYRSTVLLVFFEGLSPGEVADRIGVPASTVRARLHRALGQLRARLERERGPGWALLLAPLLAAEASAGGATAAKVSVAIAAALALAVYVGTRSTRDGSSPDRASVETLPASLDSSSAPGPQPAEPDSARTRVRGLVIDAHGEACPGAEVRAVARARLPDGPGALWRRVAGGGSSARLSPIAETRSTSAGRFELEAPGEGPFLLRAERDGCFSAWTAATARDSTVVLRVVHAGAVRGAVIDWSDRGVGEARVRLVAPPLGDAVGETVTAADGSFAFDGVPAGPCGVVVERPGFAPVFDPNVLAPRDDVIVRVSESSPVRVTVLDSRRVPVAGAELRLVPHPLARCTVQIASTDQSGTYEFADAPPTRAMLFVDGGLKGSAETLIPAVRAAGAVAVALNEPVDLRGRLSWQGAPVPGVRLVVREHRWIAEGVSPFVGGEVERTLFTRSDEHGQFECAGVVPPVRIEPAPGEPWTTTDGSLPQPPDFEVRVEPRQIVRGRVVDRRGAPVEGAAVYGAPEVGVTRADGTFEVLGGGPRSRHSLVAVRPGVGSGRAQWSPPEVEIVLDEPLEVRGLVIDERGTPVAGAWIATYFPLADTVSSHDGTFRMHIQKGDLWTLTAARSGFEERRSCPSPHLRFELVRESPKRPLRGRVVDRDGVAVPAARVDVAALETGVYCDARGRFEIRDVREGVWALGVSAGGFARRTLEDVRVPTASELIVTLEPERSIVGVVVGWDGEPIARASVRAACRDGGAGGAAESDERGGFRIGGLAPGRYDVVATHPNAWGVAWAEARDVRADGADLRLAPEGATRVAGRVLGPDAEPIMGILVSLEAEGGPADVAVHAFTDRDGRFRFERLRGSTFRISAAFNPRRAFPEDGLGWAGWKWLSDGFADLVATGIPAERESVELRFADRLEIAGRVEDVRGAPREASIHVEGAGTRGSLMSAADGTFRIRGLAAGVYRITVLHAEGTSARLDGVRAGETALRIVVR